MCQLVKTWLEKVHQSRWLMVVDTADEMKPFLRYLPQSTHGSILVISRDRQTAMRLTAGNLPIEVQKMTDDEAAQLVYTTMEDDTISRASITHLATQLEHFPLALAVVTEFLQKNVITIDICIQLLNENDDMLVDQLSGPFEARAEDERLAKASLQFNIGGLFLYQRRFKEAELLFVQVLDTRQQVLGVEDPDTLVSMDSLASTYRNQGRWKEAQSLEVQVIEMMQKVLGEEHPDTLNSMGNLASTYQNEGLWKEAKTLVENVMETRQRVFGEEHPDTLTSMANLTSIHRSLGRYHKESLIRTRIMSVRQASFAP